MPSMTMNGLRVVGLVAVALMIVSVLAILTGAQALAIPMGLAGGLLSLWVGQRMRAL